MNTIRIPRGTRLRGRTILLAASIPLPESDARYRRIRRAHFEIDQAVISLARAVFSQGGQIVLRGVPAMSMLVGMVAGEYREPSLAERSSEERPTASVEVFESGSFAESPSEQALVMYRLGHVRLNRVEGGGERRRAEEHPGGLGHLREEMIERTSPIAMVCIGGSSEERADFEAFAHLRRGAPVYVFALTGGAAASIAERSDDDNVVRRIDQEILEEVSTLRAKYRGGDEENRPRIDPEEQPVIPYPLIAQWIVDEISEERARWSTV